MAARRRTPRSATRTTSRPRIIWRGAITFGLVHVPVVLYPATRAHALDLDLIDKRDFAPVGYRHYNKATGKEVVVRNRQHFAALSAAGDILLLTTLRYADEIRPASTLRAPPSRLASLGVTSREVEMATQLIEDMAGEWKPTQYKDTYRDDLLARIRRKVRAGRKHALAEPEEDAEAARPSAEVIDLVSMLKKSLRDGKGARGPQPHRAARRARHTRSHRRERQRRTA